MIRSVLIMVIAAVAVTALACADQEAGDDQDASETTMTSLAAVSTESTVARWVSGEAVAAALEAVIDEHPNARLFVPTEIPAGTTLAEGWWPVATMERPPPREEWLVNPRVFPGADQVEVRLVLETEGGWVELLQALQGDLGDLPGERTILVGGREASLHSMLGGTVVQWGEGSEWYAVFARGLARQDVVRLAEGMRPLSGPEAAETTTGPDGPAAGTGTTTAPAEGPAGDGS